MSHPSGPMAAQPAAAAATAALQPRPWRLTDDPPEASALPSSSDPAAPPLLLRLDRCVPLPPPLIQHLEASLSSQEQERHGAYRRADDRQRFLIGRGALRRLLGHWLELPPQAVPLATAPHGKPVCPGGPAFNVSHSGDLILLALHPLRPVGVDVERLRPGLDWEPIARRMLTPAEREILAGLPAGERPQAFLAAWCRLEARLKARGDGLAGLEQLRRETLVSAAADAPSGAAVRRPDPGGPAGWSRPGWCRGDEAAATAEQPEAIWDVAVPDGYRAAAALAPSRR